MKKIFCLIILFFILLPASNFCAEERVYKELVSVYDYEYQKNKYFFIDHLYRNRFETGLSYDLLHFTLDAWTQVMDVQVWVSTQENGPDAIKGVAVLAPDNPSPSEEDAVMHKGAFRRLSIYEYGFDGDRGYFWLTKPADDATTVAVSYLLKDKKTVGTMAGEGHKPDKVLLKLIKPANQVSTEKYKATWPLMMKNVYYLGKGLDKIKYINLKITNISDTVSKTGSGRGPRLNTFGLDMIDECRYYMHKGDGIVDFNSFNLNLQTGILIFPGLQPFNPEFDSRFQLEDDDNKADIYKSVPTDELKALSKYKITVIDMLRSKSDTALRTESLKSEGES